MNEEAQQVAENTEPLLSTLPTTDVTAMVTVTIFKKPHKQNQGTKKPKLKTTERKSFTSSGIQGQHNLW